MAAATSADGRRRGRRARQATAVPSSNAVPPRPAAACKVTPELASGWAPPGPSPDPAPPPPPPWRGVTVVAVLGCGVAALAAPKALVGLDVDVPAAGDGVLGGPSAGATALDPVAPAMVGGAVGFALGETNGLDVGPAVPDGGGVSVGCGVPVGAAVGVGCAVAVG